MKRTASYIQLWRRVAFFSFSQTLNKTFRLNTMNERVRYKSRKKIRVQLLYYCKCPPIRLKQIKKKCFNWNSHHHHVFVNPMELFKWIQLNKIINVNECNIAMPRILSIQNEQYRSQLWLDLCLREFRLTTSSLKIAKWWVDPAILSHIKHLIV